MGAGMQTWTDFVLGTPWFQASWEPNVQVLGVTQRLECSSLFGQYIIIPKKKIGHNQKELRWSLWADVIPSKVACLLQLLHCPSFFCGSPESYMYIFRRKTN